MTDTTTPPLSPDELRLLAVVLDVIVPPSAERGMPGAGEIGLAGDLDARAPTLRPGIRTGLAHLNEAARGQGAEDFAALARADRVNALNAVSETDPGLLPGLIFHTYSAYYQDARVLEALGLEARPPFPKGYPMEPTDPGLLSAVRRRRKLYREC